MKYIVIILNILFFVSCNTGSDKDVVPQAPQNLTPRQKLIGKWSLVREAADINRNGVMDDNEVNFRNKDNHRIFEEDGTGGMIYIFQGSERTSSYKWQMDNDFVYLNWGSYIDTLFIEQLTEKDLRYRYTPDGDYGYEWRVFVKSE